MRSFGWVLGLLFWLICLGPFLLIAAMLLFWLRPCPDEDRGEEYWAYEDDHEEAVISVGVQARYVDPYSLPEASDSPGQEM